MVEPHNEIPRIVLPQSQLQGAQPLQRGAAKNDDDGDKKSKAEKHSIYINLPTPNPQIIETLSSSRSGKENDLIVNNYLESVKVIARMEADLIYKVASKKFTLWWRVLSVVLAFIALIIGLALGYRLSPKFGDMSFTAEPVVKQERK